MQDKILQLLKDLRGGSYTALARAITVIENDLPGSEEMLQLLDGVNHTNLIGITGPPGAGKSTLVNASISHWTGREKRVAVIAVDPSSPFNFGALLGDRIRMSEFYNHPQVFIRSLASRGALGGLSAKILEITDVVKCAPFDYILVETVGVGQSEVEISGLADCTVVALVPEAGDEVQTLKSGIMEIADVFVVNKADREASETLYRNLRILVHERADGNDEIPVIRSIATEGTGIEELANAIDARLLHQQNFEKKVQLLTDKAWRLIEARRMKDLSRKILYMQIAENLSNPTFNLYSLVEQLAGEVTKR